MGADEERRRRQGRGHQGKDRQAELDAKAAARDAERADPDAADAIEFAEWAVEYAALTILDAIDAHVHVDVRAKAARS